MAIREPFTTLSPAVQEIVTAASQEAGRRKSPDITLEHLLLAALRAPAAGVKELLADLGADVATLEFELTDYLDLIDATRSLRPKPKGNPLQRALTRFVVRTQSAGRPIDLLVAIAEEKTEYAASLIAAEGIAPLDLQRRVSHDGRPAPPPLPPDAALARVLLHDDDYTPMDFVVAVLTEVFTLPPDAARDLMLQVHQTGDAAIGTWPRPQAEDLLARVKALAEEQGFPLRCTLAPA